MDSRWATANNYDGSPAVGKRFNNPGNMRCSEAITLPYKCSQTNGNGWFANFPDLKTGIAANVELYSRFYAGRTPNNTVSIWAQSDSSNYRQAVKNCF